ncbi:MAG: response regulator [Pseudomonadota bacterium]|nr:response regulator [Pseudomonadota bacterium]
MAHILVADDDTALAEIWKDALEDGGHTVETAGTGSQALTLLREGDFDLLITDVNMPDGSGIYTTSEARFLQKRIPIIVASGNAGVISSGMLVRLPKIGADQVLIKPVDVDALLKAVADALKNGPKLTIWDLVRALFPRQLPKEQRNG